MKRNFLAVASLGALVVVFFHTCSQKPDIPVLASVNGSEIRADAFRDRLKTIWLRVDADNFKIRRDLLETMIEEKLLLQAAQQKGMQATPEYLHKAQTIAIDVVLDAYRDAVADTLAEAQVTAEEVQRFMQLMNEKVSARHLFARTREQAEALRKRLLNGESFDVLARDVFEDPKLATTGGWLGWFGWEDMELAWSRAAQKLDIGEVSEPVRVRNGYSIIRVEARKRIPLMSEGEHLKLYDKAEWIVQHRKRAEAIIAHDRRVLASLLVRFHDDNINTLLKRLSLRGSNPATEDSVLALPLAELPGDMVLANTVKGPLTLAEFREMARLTSERQRGKIRDRVSLEKFISGLILRQHLLEQAGEAGIDKRDDVLQKIRLKKEKYLITRMMQSVLDTVRIAPDTLRAYYEKRRDEFIFPRMVRVSEITVASREQAEALRERLSAGEAFSDLARAYSIRKRTARLGGDAGYRMKEEFGEHAEEIFSLAPGEIAGPFAIDDFYTLFQVTDIRPERRKTFEEARQEIEEKLLPVKRGAVLQAFFEKQKQAADIRMDLKALARVVSPSERSFEYEPEK